MACLFIDFLHESSFFILQLPAHAPANGQTDRNESAVIAVKTERFTVIRIAVKLATFLSFVDRDILSSEPLVQDVQHFSTEVDE